MSTYAPQSGETENTKEPFLKDWEDMMSRVPRTEKIVIGADLNGHVGKIQVFFKECMEENDMVKGTEKGRTSWKAWRA